MIPLTRLNQQELILNCDLIKCIEHAHDTVVTLLNGEKLTVQETPAEIVEYVVAFRRRQGDSPDSVLRRLIALPPEAMVAGWDGESQSGNHG